MAFNTLDRRNASRQAYEDQHSLHNSNEHHRSNGNRFQEYRNGNVNRNGYQDAGYGNNQYGGQQYETGDNRPQNNSNSSGNNYRNNYSDNNRSNPDSNSVYGSPNSSYSNRQNTGSSSRSGNNSNSYGNESNRYSNDRSYGQDRDMDGYNSSSRNSSYSNNNQHDRYQNSNNQNTGGSWGGGGTSGNWGSSNDANNGRSSQFSRYEDNHYQPVRTGNRHVSDYGDSHPNPYQDIDRRYQPMNSGRQSQWEDGYNTDHMDVGYNRPNYGESDRSNQGNPNHHDYRESNYSQGRSGYDRYNDSDY